MNLIKKILKCILYILTVPVFYLLISYIITIITVNNSEEETDHTEIIYLSTNGVHLNIVIQKKDLEPILLKDLILLKNDQYISFGWGDENFYINTPNWNDLTFENAFRALFLKGPTLMHLTRYQRKRNSWVAIQISKSELTALNEYISKSFKLDTNGSKIIVPNAGYAINDDFYKANGNYSCFKTCNSWVNTSFKKSGLKACLWTPFDFGLIGKYE